MPNHSGWIGVDLDGTLAEYTSTPADQWDPMRIGKPIPKMVSRIYLWLERGIEVRIVTARVHPACDRVRDIELAIWRWLSVECGLPPLPIQAHKDYQMIQLWDDRAVGVIANTGERADGLPG